MRFNQLILLFISLMAISTMGLAQNTETYYLSGTGADHTVKWDFLCSDGMNSGRWTKIAVPSCWEQQGFGSYNYGHDKFETRLDETGSYRYQFKTPKNWSEKQIEIVFEGVMTDAEVRINGQICGPVHQGGFYQFRYDITKLLKPGKTNQLDVLVKKKSANMSVNYAERQADFWVFGGIYRPVYLEAKPKANIRRVAVDARANGNFFADVFLSANKENTAAIKVEVQSLDGKTWASFQTNVIADSVRIAGQVNKPNLWSPEYPNLYQAIFSTLDKSGNVLHRYQQRIGFRTVEVRESDGIYVNGTRIKMKGVNRHTFHPKYGRTSSKALSIEAVNLIKDMNMNAVRMSHYPPDQHFLDVCDSLGLFVIDELLTWQKPALDDTVGLKLLTEMVIRDVNHPSILLWANGNEGGENNNLNHEYAKIDIQKRTVIHPWQDFGLLNTFHYPRYNYMVNDGFAKRKIYLPTEFIHGLYDGGLGAGLDDYWRLMWNDPLCAGGFLWVFADEAISRTDKGGQLDTDGNHAPDGILGPYLEKEGSFFTIKEIWSPVFFEKRYITNDFNGKFQIENRYSFTNLNECSFVAEWVRFSNPGQAKNEEIGASQPLKTNLPAGHKGNLEVTLPSNWQQYDALRIKVTDRYGRHINTWSWPTKPAAEKIAEITPQNANVQLTKNENANELMVNAGNLQLTFSKKNGKILKVQKGDKIIPFTNGPVLVTGDRKVASFTQQTTRSGDIEVKTVFDNNTYFTWTITSKGLVTLDVAYKPATYSPYTGITFDFPEDQIAGMKWLGNGPYRVYKNRMKGTTFGLWEKAYNNTITGESGYIYPEFKGYHANTYWVELQGKENNGFSVLVQSNDIFLKMLSPTPPQDPQNTAIEYPSGDISFLHSINAIGTKFTKTADFGPESAPAVFRSEKIFGEVLELKLTFIF